MPAFAPPDPWPVSERPTLAELVQLARDLDATFRKRPPVTPREQVYLQARDAYREATGRKHGRRMLDKRAMAGGWNSTADHNFRVALAAVWRDRNP